MEIWVRHLLGVETKIAPIERLEGSQWSWFVGLDQDATRIGNALWEGKEPGDRGRERILALFRMNFVDQHVMIERIAGEAIYMILAAAPDDRIHMKPQNLITGLPLKELSGA